MIEKLFGALKWVLGCCLVLVGVGALCIIIYMLFVIPYLPDECEVTIEHLWVDNNAYYFADSDGAVYKLGNGIRHGEKVVYCDMPKQRFESLVIGGNYSCVCLSHLDNWLSVSERRIGE